MWSASLSLSCCSTSRTTSPSTASVLTPCVSCVPSRQLGPHQLITWEGGWGEGTNAQWGIEYICLVRLGS
jgi:hypothetical protein